MPVSSAFGSRDLPEPACSVRASGSRGLDSVTRTDSEPGQLMSKPSTFRGPKIGAISHLQDWADVARLRRILILLPLFESKFEMIATTQNNNPGAVHYNPVRTADVEGGEEAYFEATSSVPGYGFCSTQGRRCQNEDRTSCMTFVNG